MTPITLVGKNLGERHRYLNAAVNKAYKSQQDFNGLEDSPEQSAVDRIFKINLASKLRNTDYIIKNLKDDDMLYVSKALKCKWLIEPTYEHIINPEYLEECLYPSMTTTAVTKMKHWVYKNLKNSERCQRFFVYYCDKIFKLAVKFLRNCSADFIQKQFLLHIHKISLQDFKIFCEKNPQVAKVFFDTLVSDEDLKELYLSKEKQYFNTIKSLLKSDGAMVLDITEKYFNKHKIESFNSKATKLIMKQHRPRFIQKPELYTSFLLKLTTLSSCLNTEEAVDLILTLARDNYLVSGEWFNYKKVDPLIKRIKPEDRGAIKKKVFVDKDFGTIVQKWPYDIPSSPTRVTKKIPIFEDYVHNPEKYNEMTFDFRAMLQKRKCAKWLVRGSAKTMLDKLFDEYRVVSYDKALFELRNKIRAESSAQNRQYMMLVLVSKCGGLENNVASLVQLLSDYKNEPPQLRAAVVRSLVKRAHVWRVPDHTWNQILEFSHGLGLNGKLSEAECIEGIHAVVIRKILVDRKCDPEIMSIYCNNFSTLKQYSFSQSERSIISDILPKILFAKACEETEVNSIENLINKLLDTLSAYRLSIQKYPGLIPKIKSLAKTDIVTFRGVLQRLFISRIARRELFKVNFAITENEDSYLNALRHDVDVISIPKLVKLFLHNDKFVFKHFFCKISIYFNENNGLAKQFLNILKAEEYQKILAKPLALLLGDELMLYIKNVDKSVVDIKDKLFAAALRANVHLARPAVNIDIFGWSSIGTKAVANKVLVCRNTEVDSYVKKLLQNKRTVKLANLVARRSCNYFYCFTVLSKIKPSVALKSGLQILMHDNKVSAAQENTWDVIQPLIENFDIDSKKYLKLPDVSSMPVLIQPAYSVILYKKYRKKSIYKSMPFLCVIENLLPNLPAEFINSILVEYLRDGLPKVPDEYYEDFDVDCNCLYIRIIIKYLLLCETDESQNKRYELIGVIFFDKMKSWLHCKGKKNGRGKYLDEFLASFRYYKVFLNDNYISCIPIMNNALEWMKKNLPIEGNFKHFVHMHLNMLYYTAIKESIGMLPNNCINDNNQMEARNIIGNIFGKYVAQEINTLKMTYFNSVQYLYKDIFLNLETNFIHSCELYTQSLINGVLDQSEATDNVLAVYLLTDRRHFLRTAPRNDVLLRLRKCKNIEMQMIWFAETFLQI